MESSRRWAASGASFSTLCRSSSISQIASSSSVYWCPTYYACVACLRCLRLEEDRTLVEEGTKLFTQSALSLDALVEGVHQKSIFLLLLHILVYLQEPLPGVATSGAGE